MSLDEVRGLYPDGQLIKLRKPEVGKVEAYWVASYEENGERYSVLLEFHRDRLTEIWVNGKSEKACAFVIEQVENKLGKPFLDEQYGQTSEKRWKSSTELIVARKAKVADGYSGNLCGVQYKPFGVVG